MVTLLTTRYFSVGKQRVSNGEYTDHRGLSTKNFMVSKVTMRYFREVFQMVTKLTIGISGTVFGKLRQIFVPPIFFRSVFLDRISWNLAGAKGLTIGKIGQSESENMNEISVNNEKVQRKRSTKCPLNYNRCFYLFDLFLHLLIKFIHFKMYLRLKFMHA